MLDEAAMRIAEIVRRLAKREAAAPSAQHVPPFGRRLQRLFAIFLHLPLLFLRREQRHAHREQRPHLVRELVRDLDRLDGTYAQSE